MFCDVAKNSISMFLPPSQRSVAFCIAHLLNSDRAIGIRLFTVCYDEWKQSISVAENSLLHQFAVRESGRHALARAVFEVFLCLFRKFAIAEQERLVLLIGHGVYPHCSLMHSHELLAK